VTGSVSGPWKTVARCVISSPPVKWWTSDLME
jgi:hypothetical protein